MRRRPARPERCTSYCLPVPMLKRATCRPPSRGASARPSARPHPCRRPVAVHSPRRSAVCSSRRSLSRLIRPGYFQPPQESTPHTYPAVDSLRGLDDELDGLLRALCPKEPGLLPKARTPVTWLSFGRSSPGCPSGAAPPRNQLGERTRFRHRARTDNDKRVLYPPGSPAAWSRIRSRSRW